MRRPLLSVGGALISHLLAGPQVFFELNVPVVNAPLAVTPSAPSLAFDPPTLDCPVGGNRCGNFTVTCAAGAAVRSAPTLSLAFTQRPGNNNALPAGGELLLAGVRVAQAPVAAARLGAGPLRLVAGGPAQESW